MNYQLNSSRIFHRDRIRETLKISRENARSMKFLTIVHYSRVQALTLIYFVSDEERYYLKPNDDSFAWLLQLRTEVVELKFNYERH